MAKRAGNHNHLASAPGVRSVYSLRMQRTSRLELLVAASAVFISLASFWLAWKQTSAMDAQVKAMSWPYLQLRSGNYDIDSEQRVLSLSLENAGVGPTRVAWLELAYDGTPVGNFVELVDACCSGPEDNPVPLTQLSAVTGDPSPTLIPADSDETVFRVEHRPSYDAFWNALDRARWKISARACHCSILGQCWITGFEAEPAAVKACPPAPETDWRG